MAMEAQVNEDPIATRTIFILENGLATTRIIRIEIFSPYEVEGYWMCKYKVHVPDRDICHQAPGGSSFQALSLAMEAAKYETLSAEQRLGLSLEWGGKRFELLSTLREQL